ncbi:MAG: type II secretion system F family protein [Candidatus Dormibacteraeota bacterium]|nr:type II secretion system F family protein [Candidatus Dormibacteraeota bacterium]
MATYRTLAYDAGGRRVSRAVKAETSEQVKQRLWADGLHIVSIRKGVQLPSLEQLFPSVIRVRRSEVILFTKQLATFQRVGMPILEGLGVLSEQATSNLMKRAVAGMVTDLTEGFSLSDSMARHPRIFSALYVDMIRSAEVSGNLDNVLRQLADYMSRDESAIRKVRNAMIYPAIVVALALGVVTVLVVYVLPAFARLFGEFRATMPLPTRILLTVGLFSRGHAALLLGGMFSLVIVSLLFSRTAAGRRGLDVVVIRIPVLGKIMRYAIVERYLRTLATLVRAGVPIAQMTDTANRALGNHVFEEALNAVRGQMLSGEGFAAPLERTGLFPKLVVQMVRVGEETGKLDTNLDEAAAHYAEEVDYRLKQAITLLEPALILIVGAMVGFIAISVIAPMYGLVHAIH